jgi:hypothetical protein
VMGYIKKGQQLILTSFSAMKRRTFKIIALVAFLVLGSCVLPCGCAEGVMEIKGMAYEWIDAPSVATSRIYIENSVLESDVEPTLKEMQENIASDISTVPLGDVKIAIGIKEVIEKLGEKYYSRETFSDFNGDIYLHHMSPAIASEYLVKASKSGYMEVVGEAEPGDTGTIVIYSNSS